MSTETITTDVSTVPPGVDGAVGVPGNKWFVAIVKNNTEKSSGEKLTKLGYTCYVPVQEETRVWKNGKRVKSERVVIHSVVFVNCTEAVRKEIVNLPFILRFMVNNAGTTSPSGHKPLATIPDSQIEQLRFMLGKSDVPVTFSATNYRKGDLVRVIRGNLLGLVGEIQKIDDKHSEITIHLDFLGNARLNIETINVEPISRG